MEQACVAVAAGDQVIVDASSAGSSPGYVSHLLRRKDSQALGGPGQRDIKIVEPTG